MSNLIAVILLSILMFPLAAAVYLLVFFAFIAVGGYRDEDTGLLVAGLVTWGFIALYWLGLWRKTVTWTPQRRTLSGLSFVGAALAGIVLGAFVRRVLAAPGDGFAIFVGTLITPLLWVAATIFIWREAPAERAARVARSGAAGGVVCPTCGYNLTGLKGTRCPECGSEFTLDHLLASQPAREQARLEA